MDATASALSAAGSRVGQACQACRRKKIKCEGVKPCKNCSTRQIDCEFPGARDHASTSRHYAASFEARFQQADALCHRLESLVDHLSRACSAAGTAQNPPGAQPTERTLNDQEAANVLQSLPNAVHGRDGRPVEDVRRGRSADGSDDDARPSAKRRRTEDESDSLSDLIAEDGLEDSDDEETGPRTAAMVTDSYGRSRFIGGAANLMLIDAAQNTPTPGSAVATHETAVSADGGGEEAELPLFVRGRLWPRLSWLPQPEQLERPPQYVSDLLIGLYFDRMHYTLPVLFKPHFMTRYRRLLASAAQPASMSGPSASNTVEDPDFLLIFFAVCACGRSMLPEGSDSGMPGLEFYEKALLLYYASSGQASVERVQCLALLAMCSAGWNTLTKSWSLVGQAVRDAVDIGLHISSRRIRPMGHRSTTQEAATGSDPGTDMASQLLRRQINRRVWWSVYSLDRVTSICLGRPTAIDDRDCACDLPWDVADENLQRQCITQAQARAQSLTAPYGDPGSVGSLDPPSTSSSPLTGFIAFARLCRIAGKIQRLGSPSSLVKLFAPRATASTAVKKARIMAARVAAHDKLLREWLNTLPDSIRFSANNASATSDTACDPSLVMCVIIFMMHSGSLLSLYWCLIRGICIAPPSPGAHNTDEDADHVPQAAKDAILQCVSAARSSINAAELVRDLVPPSHNLAICVHSLTLAGVALLRIPTNLNSDSNTIDDVHKCIRLLSSLESRWSGAVRCRAIIERLLTERQGPFPASDRVPTGLNGSRAETLDGSMAPGMAQLRGNSPQKRLSATAFPRQDMDQPQPIQAAGGEGHYQRSDQDERALWRDMYWSELGSIDDTSIAILSDYWAEHPM